MSTAPHRSSRTNFRKHSPSPREHFCPPYQGGRVPVSGQLNGTQGVLHSLKQIGLFFLAISIFFTSHSFAQQTHRYAQQGVTEGGGSVTYMQETTVFEGNEQSTFSTLTIAPYIGYFIADNFELGANPLGISYLSFGSSSLYRLNIFAAPAYHWKTLGGEYGFIEPLLGYTAELNGETRGGFSWGGRVGAKLQITEGGLLVFAVQYLVIDLSESGDTSRTGYNELTVSAGFTVWR